MLIDTFVNAIFLYDDKIVITFNYKDGTDTITFDDLKAALDKENTGSDLDCLTAPSRSKRYKACSDFFQKSEEYLRTKVFEETVLANIEVIAAQNQVSMINSKII
ncbi:hypothetical protein [Intestinimonas butyriciproducens]